MNPTSVRCYCAVIRKRVQAETLAEAIGQLVSYHETLQLNFANGERSLQPSLSGARNHGLLVVCDGAGKSISELEALSDQALKKLAVECGSKSGPPVRGLLVQESNDFNKLFLLFPAATVDGKGCALIFEDLYRIYEQLSHGRAIALRPIQKTFLEFFNDAASAGQREIVAALIEDRQAHDLTKINSSEAERPLEASFSLVFDNNIKRRLSSRKIIEFGAKSIDLLVWATLGALNQYDDNPSGNIWVRCDYRYSDETLRYTAGALSRTFEAPREFAIERGNFREFNGIRMILRDLSRTPSAANISTPSNAGQPILLNLEYLVDEPWLGGDDWEPEGYIVKGGEGISSGYSLEILPLLFHDRIEIRFSFNEEQQSAENIQQVASGISSEVNRLLNYCEGYADANDYWRNLYSQIPAQTKIETSASGLMVNDQGRGSLKFSLDSDFLQKSVLQFNVDPGHFVLAVFSVLITRLNGQEDIALLCMSGNETSQAVFPLLLCPRPDIGLDAFLEQVGAVYRRASSFSKYAFDILGEMLREHGRPAPTLEIGYVIKSADRDISLTSSAIDGPVFIREPEFVLEYAEVEGPAEIRISYDKNSYTAMFINQFAGHLNKMLEAIAADGLAKIGDIGFEGRRETDEVVSALSKDAFNF